MSHLLTRSAVRIYGALSGMGGGGSDVLMRLLPFIEPLLKEQNGKRFDPEALASAVRDTYRWNFNTDIVEVFVPRLMDAGWLQQASVEGNSTAFVVSVNESEQEEDYERSASDELRAIAERFQEFANELSPLTSIPREVEEYEDILIEWLLYVEAFSEKNIEFTSEVKKSESGTLEHVVSIPNITSLRDEEKFLCARFVQHEITSGSADAEVLARIAAIGLLTEVVQDFVRPTDVLETSNLVVYLDAPIALELLGVSGKAARANTKPIIDELHRIGAQTRVFSQSLEEMRSVLKAVLKSDYPTGPTAQALARGEVLREFVTSVSQDPTPFLEEEGIRITHRTLDQTPSEHQYFSEEHRKEIFAAQRYQQNLAARDHDSDITTLVMRLRRGRRSRDIFKSHFVAMTRNGLLAQVVRKSCIAMGMLNGSEIPPVVHRRVLAATMWLRTGLGSSDLEVPKRMLLASCEQVLALRRSVVDAVTELTKSIDDEEKARQLSILIRQDRSAQMLMDKTLGAASVVTEENLPEILQEMIHPHLEEERQRGAKAVEEEKERSKKRETQLKKQLQSAKGEASARSFEIEERLAEDEAIVRALAAEVASKLAKGRKVRWAISALMAVAFCAPVLFTQTSWSIAMAFILNGILAVLTLTGRQLLGVATSEEKAKTDLYDAASNRQLTKKLDRFEIEWKANVFQIKRRSRPGSDDLLSVT